MFKEKIKRLIKEAVETALNSLPTEFYDALNDITGHPYTWYLSFDWHSPEKRNNIYLVSLNDKYAYYDKNKNRYIVDMCFDMGKPFFRHDFTQVKKNGKYNILKIDGSFLLPDWVHYIDFDIWNEGTFFVQYDDSRKYVLVDENGKKIGNYIPVVPE